ncbi:MAG: DUF4124 domain-containing protein [Gallionellaceae bacterium]|nr:DUF4124 domain-containing protein [Gallionellaceae bacterium]
MIDTKNMGIGLLLLAAFTSSAEAKLYKWVDDQGETHYGETIPPEYADRDNVQFDDKGRIIKRNEKMTKEARRAQEAAEAKKRADEAAEFEQRRKDKMLLNTYSNEREIDLARDRNLQQVEALINSIQLLQKSAQESLDSYQVEQEKVTQAGRKIPASLESDIADAVQKTIKLRQQMTTAQEKAAKVRASFEADKLRYRELTGGDAKEASGVTAIQKH